MDVFATYLLTTPHPDCQMGDVEEGGIEKLVIVVISRNLLTENLDRKHVTVLLLFTYERCCERC